MANNLIRTKRKEKKNGVNKVDETDARNNVIKVEFEKAINGYKGSDELVSNKKIKNEQIIKLLKSKIAGERMGGIEAISNSNDIELLKDVVKSTVYWHVKYTAIKRLSNIMNELTDIGALVIVATSPYNIEARKIATKKLSKYNYKLPNTSDTLIMKLSDILKIASLEK